MFGVCLGRNQSVFVAYTPNPRVVFWACLCGVLGAYFLEEASAPGFSFSESRVLRGGPGFRAFRMGRRVAIFDF